MINAAPAERYAIELEADADPGIYSAHCHKMHRVTTEDAYSDGMATAIVYEEAMESEEFAELVDDTGYGG